MADFSTPFASTAARRSPNADEKANGFPCGAADQTLFNGMFHRIEAELGNLISFAGLTGSDADFSQVRKAVQALIDAATGGGDTSNYLLISQAAARLPIYPEVLSADGRINFTQPAAGTVRMPGGIGILHRGINLITTAQTDFTTLANRTYHLRWSPADGFQLKLITDPVYNPQGYPETDRSFDSSYDDMLLARVITNSSNVATVTSLSNKHSLHFSYERGYQLYAVPNGSLGNAAVVAASKETITFNLARTPIFYQNGWEESGAPSTPGSPSSTDGSESNVSPQSINRYNSVVFAYGYNNPMDAGYRPKYQATFMAMN